LFYHHLIHLFFEIGIILHYRGDHFLHRMVQKEHLVRRVLAILMIAQDYSLCHAVQNNLLSFEKFTIFFRQLLNGVILEFCKLNCHHDQYDVEKHKFRVSTEPQQARVRRIGLDIVDQSNGSGYCKEQLLSDWHLKKHTGHEANVPNLTLTKSPSLLGFKMHRLHVGHVPDCRGLDSDRNERVEEDDFLVGQTPDAK
jgi:hypothetical protein